MNQRRLKIKMIFHLFLKYPSAKLEKRILQRIFRIITNEGFNFIREFVARLFNPNFCSWL